MEIKYEIMDEENLLELGDFMSFFYSSITLTIKEGGKSIEMNSTIHKIFLYALLEGLNDLYQNKRSFNLNSFGKAYNYNFAWTKAGLELKKNDNIHQRSQTYIFKNDEFYKSTLKFFKTYFTNIEKVNKEVLNWEEYRELKELFEKFAQ